MPAPTFEATVPAESLRKGDTCSSCEANDLIPADGEVIEGAASVNESAITGESAPVIREAGGDRSAVTGGTTVLSDKIVVEVTANPGESFMDRMIGLIEGAKRQKTPNEIALIDPAQRADDHLHRRLPDAQAVRPVQRAGDVDAAVTVPVLVSLLVCLIPTTIGGLLSAIGIAGNRPHGAAQRAGHERPGRRGGRRHRRAAAGQDRHDHDRQPPGERVHPRARASRPDELADAAQLSSAWPTRRPEGPEHRHPGRAEVRPAAAVHDPRCARRVSSRSRPRRG